MPLFFYDIDSKSTNTEKVYGNLFLKLLYPKNVLLFWLAFPLRFLFAQLKLLSRLYAHFQKTKKSAKKIAPFCQKFSINTAEFEKPIDQFTSFNDFFMRKLKTGSRPIDKSSNSAICIADGRYQFFQNLHNSNTFFLKNQRFELKKLLQNHYDPAFENGTMIIARLCPSDYHRFHFPIDCIPTQPELINGPLFSVNPVALVKNINYLAQNKRMLTTLKSKPFNDPLMIEVGATNVGSILQTYTPETQVKKGDEKGAFSFGGSAVILLFKPNTIKINESLLAQTEYEVYCQMGFQLGTLNLQL